MKFDRFTKLLLAAITLLLAMNFAIYLPLSGGSTQASPPAFLQVGKTVNLGGITGEVQILKVDPSGWVFIKKLNTSANVMYWSNSNQWDSVTERP